ncbi:VAN3-binding protein-like [Salvia hispanica]|uniref:VAN3-binding protein-like n=1 Tax=Salvia hispanica TaxID=49212 RepID=UPI0020098479|nr:VAN3-binding protein-like [Salvia hispanica]
MPDFHRSFLSPSASDFQQIFTTNNSLLSNHTNQPDDDSFRSAQSTPRASLKQNNNIQMDSKQPRTWLATLFGSRNETKKEGRRLQTAQLHAALSLTQLAAAIHGITTAAGCSSNGENSPFQPGTPCQDMGNVVSSAAALITNVCAEAAESLGADRARVQGAVDSGVAVRTPIDMIAITATTATCLRGASLLRSRAAAVPLSRVQEMLKISAEIRTIMPSGRKESTRVSVYVKHQNLMFCFKKKYLRGALTSTKEYQVTNITEERRETQGNCLLCLKTKNGIIKLLFEDEMQSKIWISTILNLLEMQNLHIY